MAILGAFPLFKLGVLALYQMSKPVSDFIKQKAKTNPIFRNYICLPSAQAYNTMETKLKMWTLNLKGQASEVRPLNEEAAIELASNLLGEAVVFVICAGGLTYEYNRQVRKEARKQRKLKLEKQLLQEKIVRVKELLDSQDEQIEILSSLIHRLRATKVE